MAHFARVKSLGWALGEELLSSLMNQLDINVSKSINGDDGGEWGPTDPIVLNGAGLQIDSLIRITDGGSAVFDDGSSMTLDGDAAVDMNDTASVTLFDSAKIRLEDTTKVELVETSSIELSGTSAFIGLSGSTQIALTGTSKIDLATGTTLEAKAGSTVALKGTVKLYGSTTIEFDAARTYREPCSLVGAVDLTKWGPDATLPTTYPHRLQQAAATSVSNPNENLRYECNVPAGATITKVEVWVTPATGHSGLPANRPQIIVYVYDSDAGTIDVVGLEAADAGTLVAYEARTLLTATVTADPIAVPQKVVCQVYGEGGTDFAAGLIIEEPTFTFTTTAMRHP